MKLTYWIARCIADHDCYSIRARTKKEVLALYNNPAIIDKKDFEAPKKVIVEYSNSFDLLQQCLSEGRAHWEV